MSIFSQLFTIFKHTDVLTRNEDKNTGRLYGEVRSMLNEEKEFIDDYEDYYEDDFEDDFEDTLLSDDELENNDSISDDSFYEDELLIKITAAFKEDLLDSATVLTSFPKELHPNLRYLLLAHYFSETDGMSSQEVHTVSQILLAVKRYYIALWTHQQGYTDKLKAKKLDCYSIDDFGDKVLDDYEWDTFVEEFIKNRWYEMHDFLYDNISQKYYSFAEDGAHYFVHSAADLRFAKDDWVQEQKVIEDVHWAIDSLIDEIHANGLKLLEDKHSAQK